MGITTSLNNKLATLILVSVFIFLVVISIGYGLQYRYEGENLSAYFDFVTMIFLLVASLLTSLVLMPWSFESISVTKLRFIGLGMMFSSIALTSFFYSKWLHPIPFTLFILVTLITGCITQAKWGQHATNISLLVCVFAIHVFFVLKVPHETGSNMLLITQKASMEFIAGNNPYRYYPSASNVPFIYLPGLWLPYTLMELLGWDYRVLNLTCLIGLVFLMEKGLPTAKNKSVILSVTFYPILFSPPIAKMIVNGHVWTYWVLLLSTMIFLQKKQYAIAALLFGLTLATRQPAIFFIGPIAMYIYRKLGLIPLIKYSMMSIGVYLLIITPFCLISKQGFWSWYMAHSSAGAEFHLPKSSYVGDFPVFAHIAASRYFFQTGLQHLLMYFQLSFVIFLIVIILFKIRANFPRFVLATGIGYIWFVLFNPYIADYVYVPGFILMSIGMASIIASDQQKLDHPKTLVAEPVI